MSGSLLTAHTPDLMRPLAAVAGDVGKMQRALVADMRSKVPPQVRKAVRARYRRVRASEPDLRGKFTARKAGIGHLMGELSVDGWSITYTGKRKTLDLSPDIPTPFAVPPKMRSGGSWVSAFARRRYEAAKPWRIRLATGQVIGFGDSKERLFVIPSKTGIPLLFRRSDRMTKEGKWAGKRKAGDIIKTIGVPSMIRQPQVAEDIRRRISTIAAQRIAHHAHRFGFGG